MPTAEPRRNLDELARLGAEVIDRVVKPALRPEDDGKFIAVDVVTGEYEIDTDDYTAVMRLRARVPTAEMWLVRPGADAPRRHEVRDAPRRTRPATAKRSPINLTRHGA